MTSTSQNILGTQFICQIAMVVHDAADACDAFAEIVGVARPTIMKANEDLSDVVTFRGASTAGRVSLGFFYLSNTAVEFIQPTADPTTWKEHLEEQGPGVHHIAFKASPFAARIEALVGQGYPLIQRGRRYAYVESEKTLGFIFEPLDIPDPATRAAAATGVLGTDQIAGVGSLVTNLNVTSAAYQKLLGVPAAALEVLSGSSGRKSATATVWDSLGCGRAFRLRMTNLDLEIGELGAQRKNAQGALSTLKKGAHHLSFVVNDLDGRVERLVSLGYPTERRGDGWALIDTSARLGTRLLLRTS